MTDIAEVIELLKVNGGDCIHCCGTSASMRREFVEVGEMIAVVRNNTKFTNFSAKRRKFLHAW